MRATVGSPSRIRAPKLPAPVWIGTDVLKVLAGAGLTKFAFIPFLVPATAGRTGDLDLSSDRGESVVLPRPGERVASGSRSSVSSCAVAPSSAPTGSTALGAEVQAFEERASELLRAGQLVAALGELEQALCHLASGRADGLESGSMASLAVVQFRWQQLVSSAIVWSFDLLAEESLWMGEGHRNGVADQALEMLCLAEMLTRPDVAVGFRAGGSTSRNFLRSLAHAGLGTYYRLRLKPKASAQFLEQAADGNARWAHPAILINLSGACVLLRDCNRALSAANSAVLALRSATGRLSGDSVDDTQKACRAADRAVRAVLGLDFGRSKGSAASSQMPGVHRGSDGKAEANVDGGGHEDEVPVMTARLNNVEVAVTQTLLVTKVLLWPWPEFNEEEAVASSSVGSTFESSDEDSGQVALEQDNIFKKLFIRLRHQAAAGIARHAAQLKSIWPEWGQPVLPINVPGVGLVLRECVLLCFLQASAIMRQTCPPSRYETWITPLLREGLALAIVLFGPKHPLTQKLVKAYEKTRLASFDPSNLRRLLRDACGTPQTKEPILEHHRPKSAGAPVEKQPYIDRTVNSYVPARKDRGEPNLRMYTARIEEVADTLRKNALLEAEAARSKRPRSRPCSRAGVRAAPMPDDAVSDDGAMPQLAPPRRESGKKRPSSATAWRPIGPVPKQPLVVPVLVKPVGPPDRPRPMSPKVTAGSGGLPGYQYHLRRGNRGVKDMWIPEPILSSAICV